MYTLNAPGNVHMIKKASVFSGLIRNPFYDDAIINTPDLIIPHIDMQNRAFVLEPLMELCPAKMHPVFHKTVMQLLEELNKREETL